jgi:hypothetical protein
LQLPEQQEQGRLVLVLPEQEQLVLQRQEVSPWPDWWRRC